MFAGDGSNVKQDETDFINLDEKEKNLGLMRRMFNWTWRLCRSYKLLLLLTLILCVLQIWMGILFSNTAGES